MGFEVLVNTIVYGREEEKEDLEEKEGEENKITNVFFNPIAHHAWTQLYKNVEINFSSNLLGAKCQRLCGRYSFVLHGLPGAIITMMQSRLGSIKFG